MQANYNINVPAAAHNRDEPWDWLRPANCKPFSNNEFADDRLGCNQKSDLEGPQQTQRFLMSLQNSLLSWQPLPCFGTIAT